MIRIVASIYILLHVIAVFINPVYLWGIDTFYYFHPVVVFFLIAFFFLSMVERFQTKMFYYFTVLINRLSGHIHLILLFALALFFYFLSASTHFLGDGYLRIRNLEGHLFLSSSEPLDNILHLLIYKYANPMKILTGADVYAVVSIISGLIIFYNFGKYLLRNNFKNDFIVFSYLLFFGLGSLQLFSGYVESYAVSTCLMFLFLLSAIKSLESKEPSIFPTVFFSIAVLFHTSSVLALPALVFIYVRYLKYEGGSKKVLNSVIIFFMIFLVSIFILFLLTGELLFEKYLMTFIGPSTFLPLFSDSNSYGIFSVYHITDVLNQILLISPALLVLLFFLDKNKWYKEEKNIFLIIVSICYFLLIFLFNPVLGYSRDWDLFSFISFPILFIVLHLVTAKQQYVLSKYLPLLVAGMIHTFSFIVLNSVEIISLERAKNLAETPYWTNKAKSLLYDELSIYYKTKDDLLKSIEMNDKAYFYEKNPRYLLRNANSYLLINDFVSAEKHYLELIRIKNGNEEIYNHLADIYFDTKQYDKALIYYKQALDLNSRNYLAWNNVGLILMKQSDFENAKTAFLESLKLNPNDSFINYYIAICYFNLKDYSKAIEFTDIAENLGYKQSITETLRNEILKEKK